MWITSGLFEQYYHHQSLLPAVLWFWNPQSQWEQFNKIWDVHRIQRWILRMIWAELPCSSWILSFSVLRLTVLFQLYGKNDSVSMIFIKGSIVLQYHGGQGNLMLKTYAWLTRKTYPAIIYVCLIHYGPWGLGLILSVYKYNRELINKTRYYSPFPSYFLTPSIVIYKAQYFFKSLKLLNLNDNMKTKDNFFLWSPWII